MIQWINRRTEQDRKAVAAALKAICTAVDADAAELALAEFEDSELAKRYPAIAPRWRRAWNEVIPFRDDPPEVRKLILLPPRLLPAVGIGIARKRPRLALPDACVIRAPAQAADCP